MFRATTSLEVGDEVTIGYIDLALPRAERRRQLRSGYFFDCECARCGGAQRHEKVLSGGSGEAEPDNDENNDGKEEDIERPLDDVAAALKAAEQRVRDGGDGMLESERAHLQRALTLLDASGCGRCHFQRLSADSMLQSNLLAAGDLRQAYGVAARLVVALEQVKTGGWAAPMHRSFIHSIRAVPNNQISLCQSHYTV